MNFVLSGMLLYVDVDLCSSTLESLFAIQYCIRTGAGTAGIKVNGLSFAYHHMHRRYKVLYNGFIITGS